MADESRWYVVHTYSGYENKVASNLETTVAEPPASGFDPGNPRSY